MTDSRLLISESPERRPYGAKVRMILKEGNELNFDGETSFLLDNKSAIICLKPLKPKLKEIGQKIEVSVEGFATATEAEQQGLKLSLAVLWAAVSRRYSLKLDYDTPLPCTVYNRIFPQSGGVSVSASPTVLMNGSDMVKRFDEVFSANSEVNEKLLVSMEIFTAARLEATLRSRFVSLVSALEPLAEAQVHGIKEIDDLIDNWQADLRSLTRNLVNNTRDDTDESRAFISKVEIIKNSLTGRLKQLKSESIRQAIKRFIKETFPDEQDTFTIVDRAYNLRSQILHEGIYDADIKQKSDEIEQIIRKIYARLLNLELSTYP